MGGGGQPEQDNVRLRVSETWNGLSPVGFVRKSSPFFVGDFLAPFNETWAAAAGGYLLL
ncbi:MAG: hypothetical protein WA982_11715 [Rubrobacteraceae bacterium]